MLKANGELPYQQNLLLCGFTSGLWAALIGSEIYVCILALISLITNGDLLGALFWIIFGQIYGVFPSLFIGLLFGSLMAVVFQFLRIQMTLLKGVILGFALALFEGILLVAAITFTQYSANLISLSFSSIEEPLLWAVLPIIVIYLLSGAWCGRELANCKLLQYRI